jgi:hypothetical protein
VTRASLREYAAVQRLRYQQPTGAEKRRLLDEIVAVTGLHRKAAIRAWPRAAGHGSDDLVSVITTFERRAELHAPAPGLTPS